MNSISIFNDEEIETVFKVEMPIEPIKDGHGFLGVILRNKVDDTIQCHICGEWFKLLSQHISGKHKIKVLEYRYKYGLPLSYPLCSKSYSANSSKNGLKNKNWLKKMTPERARAQQAKVGKKAFRWAKHSPAKTNMLGACDEQLQKRFTIIADTLGHEPGYREIEEHDPPLMPLIRNRYGNLNKFRETFGFEVHKKNKKCEYSDGNLLGLIREFVLKNKRIPTSRDCKSPSCSVYRRRFGSWNKAVLKAGVAI